jgi:hypothetical protein
MSKDTLDPSEERGRSIRSGTARTRSISNGEREAHYSMKLVKKSVASAGGPSPEEFLPDMDTNRRLALDFDLGFSCLHSRVIW